MRILHVSTRLILGGSQENTVLSCEGQARLGHDVHLAFGPIYGPEGSLIERVKAFRTPDARAITPHVVPHMVREISPRADLFCLRELEALVRTLQPDVVHTHSSKAGILGRLGAWRVRRTDRRRRPAIVHTIHGPPFMPVEGGALARAKVVVLNRVYTLAERGAAKRCDVIVSVADAMTRQFRARGIGRVDQFVTVHSGMETERFLRARPGESRDAVRDALGLGSGDFVVGTVARLAEHKGHDDLLDALADDLRARAHWKLLWVGDGWWRTRLVTRAHRLGLGVVELDRAGDGSRPAAAREASAPQVILSGLVPPERVPALMRAMDVLAHPSSREGLPRTVPQALLCGVCPVAYDVDGTSEACIDGVTGLLVRAGDVAGLRGAVRRLYDAPHERRAMAERGRERCADLFSAQRMVDELERVYARALHLAAQSAGQP